MRTLTFRLTVWYACVVTLTVAAILLAGRFYLESHLMRGVDFLNDAEFEEIFHRLETENGASNAETVADAIRLHTEIDASLFFFQFFACSAKFLNFFGESTFGCVNNAAWNSVLRRSRQRTGVSNRS